MKRYVLALDEGTTSARAILFDREANVVSMAQHEFTQIYPRPGWIEHNAYEIWESTSTVSIPGIFVCFIMAVGC